MPNWNMHYSSLFIDPIYYPSIPHFSPTFLLRKVGVDDKIFVWTFEWKEEKMLEKLLNKINDVEERSNNIISDGRKDAMHIVRMAKEEAETNLESRKQQVESRKKELIKKAVAEASEEASRIEKESIKTEAAAASDASKNLPKATKIVVENLNKILCQ